MAWNEIAPGIVQGLFEITMGRRDSALNPNGINWRPLPESIDSAMHASPILTGATAIVSAASLGVAIDTNVRLRQIQQQLNQMESNLISIKSKLDRSYEKIKAVHLKSEEAHLREALKFAMNNAISGDYSINLDSIANLGSDIQSFCDAMENPFQKITLASDMRIRLQALFQLLFGIRTSVATVANGSSNDGSAQFGIDRYQHLPIHGRGQFVESICVGVLNQIRMGELINAAREWVNAEFLLSGEEEQDKITDLIVKTGPTVEIGAAYSFREMIESSGILKYEEISSEEEIGELVENSVNAWVLSDSGLIFRLNQELTSLKNGYQIFWDENPLELIEHSKGNTTLNLLSGVI